MCRKLGAGLAAVMLLLLPAIVDANDYSNTKPFTPTFGKIDLDPNTFLESISVYTSQANFEADALSAGQILKFIEDFEEGNVPAGALAALVPPLAPGVPNVDAGGLGFPNGIDAPNIQLNVGDPINNLLVVLGDGFAGNSTTVVGANTFVDSTRVEVISGAPKTAIGMNIYDPIGGTGDYDVTVRDPSGGLLFSSSVTAGATSGSFLGFITAGGDSIGSIDIASALDGGELLDNIQLWAVPEPSAALIGLFGLLGLIGLRRR